MRRLAGKCYVARRSQALTDPSRRGVDARREDGLPFRLRLRFRREQAGLKQWEVAEALGLHNTLLSAYENGRRRPADAATFDQRHRDAIREAQRRRMSTALAETAAGQEVVARRLSREAADACLDLVDGLARTLRVPLEADLRPEPDGVSFRLRVRVGPTEEATGTAPRRVARPEIAAGAHRVA